MNNTIYIVDRAVVTNEGLLNFRVTSAPSR